MEGWFERADWLTAQASKAFQPRTPITTKDLFAGRWSELTTISDAVHESGLHVVIYGERGVGKTRCQYCFPDDSCIGREGTG